MVTIECASTLLKREGFKLLPQGEMVCTLAEI